MRQGLLHRPVTVLMILVSLGVIGTIAYQRIPLQLVPPGIVEPEISVMIPVEESTPREVLNLVSRPVEDSFRTIPGVTRINSNSGSDSSWISVEYDPTVDGDAVYADVRDRVERLLPSLPDGANRYRIFRFNADTDLPVMFAAASHTADVVQPDRLLENVVKPRLEAVPGVARVEVQGLVRRRVDIEIDPGQAVAYRIDVEKLINRLRGDNIVAPGGVVREGGTRYLLRLSSRFASFDEIRDYRINDSLVLGDIAHVGYRRALDEFAVRVDGEISYLLEISKQSEANTVETCRQLVTMMEEELANDPRLEGFSFHPFWNTGTMIEASIGSLRTTCMFGGLFAVLILYFFLRRVRVTFVVASAIPLSLLIAVVVIYFRKGTFNILSLTGLTLAIGMLIDNAIVIAENIFRLRQQGLSTRDAAAAGTREVALAVTLATLTTVAVFLPVMFLGGESQIRVLLTELGLPVCYSLVASLFVALVFIPLATVYLGERKEIAGSAPPRRQVYSAVIRWLLGHRVPALLLCLLVLGSMWYPQSQLSKTNEERRTGHINFSIRCPRYYTLMETDRIMVDIQQRMLPLYEELGVESCASWFGKTGGTFAFFLAPGKQAVRSEFLATIKPHMPEVPGVQIRLDVGEGDGATRNEVWIEVRGRDPDILDDILVRAADTLRDQPGILDVNTQRERGSTDEIRVKIEREKAQRYDVNPSSVAMLIAWALRGAPLTDYESEDEEVPFWIQFAGSDMNNVGDLYKLEVYSQGGSPVTLANIAGFTPGSGLQRIQRRDGRVRQWLHVVTDKEVQTDQVQLYLQYLMSELDVPDGYEIHVRDDGLEEDFQSIFMALLLGLVLIFVIMGVLFESIALPFSVIFSIPFLFVGAFWAMYVMDEPFTPVSAIGFVILLGIVVNNAIVLVDCINRFRQEQLRSFAVWARIAVAEGFAADGVLELGHRTRAIAAAGSVRLRPILMTACTTICGLMPLVVIPHQGEGLDYRPLSVVVLGGLTVSTAMTLIVVPILYSLLDDTRHGIQRVILAILPR